MTSARDRGHLVKLLMVLLLWIKATDAVAQVKAPINTTSGSIACAGKDLLGPMATSDPASHAKIMASAAATPNGEAVLWRIEREGRPASHLFGTAHLSDRRIVTLPRPVASALGKSKVLAVELTKRNDMQLVETMKSHPELFFFADGRTLRSLLSPAEFEAFAGDVRRDGVSADAADAMRPWLAFMMLAMPQCERQQIARGAQSLDARLESLARGQGAHVIALETIEQQVGVFAGLTDEMQVALLKHSIRVLHLSEDLRETTISAYLGRKIAAIWPLTLHLVEREGMDRAGYSDLYKSLVDDRNLAMRDKALPLVDKGAAFIAVGALHLVGHKGLVQLFRDAGYTVTPVH